MKNYRDKLHTGKLIFSGCFIAFAIVVLVIAAMFDMEISDKLYSGTDSALSLIGAFLGKIPAYAILAYAFTVMLCHAVNSPKKTKIWRAVLSVVYSVAILGSVFLAVKSALEDVMGHSTPIAAAAAVVVLCVILFYRNRILPQAHADKLKKWAVTAIVAVVAVILAVTVIKLCWGRYRYNELHSVTGAEYSPWYRPLGYTGSGSFPSGHTALWGCLIMLVPLAGIYGIKCEGFIYATTLLSQFIIGVFRIMGGYHYLGDITAAMLISFVICNAAIMISYRPDYSNKTLGEKNIFDLV